MTKLLEDEKNLKILKAICSGIGLSVNLSYLSRNLKKHRNTIRTRVELLLKNKIINPPMFPFVFGLFKAYPLIVLVYADLPHTPEIMKWMREDKHIFAAFKIRLGRHNTLLIVFQKDILSYHLWREDITEKGKIPSREVRAPSEAHFFSNRLVVKYEPNEGIKILKSEFEKNNNLILHNFDYTHKLNELDIKIMELLLNGKGIRLNETFLVKKLGMHKKTIRRRIQIMLKEKLILNPVCRFPSFFVPPNCVLQIARIEIHKNKKEVLQFLKQDHHIPISFHICEKRFNYLLFEIFFEAGDHVEWSSRLREKFMGSIGDTDTIILMEKNTFNIDQQKVSLGVINEYITSLNSKKNKK